MYTRIYTIKCYYINASSLPNSTAIPIVKFVDANKHFRDDHIGVSRFSKYYARYPRYKILFFPPFLNIIFENFFLQNVVYSIKLCNECATSSKRLFFFSANYIIFALKT